MSHRGTHATGAMGNKVCIVTKSCHTIGAFRFFWGRCHAKHNNYCGTHIGEFWMSKQVDLLCRFVEGLEFLNVEKRWNVLMSNSECLLLLLGFGSAGAEPSGKDLGWVPLAAEWVWGGFRWVSWILFELINLIRWRIVHISFAWLSYGTRVAPFESWDSQL